MSSTSPAVGRALDVLLYLASRSGPVSGAAIMRDLDIPRSSAYHLLEVLTERGFVVYLADQRTYGLGVSAFEVGSAYLRHGPLEMWSRPVLKQLVAQVHETSHLGILHGAETLYLLRESPYGGAHGRHAHRDRRAHARAPDGQRTRHPRASARGPGARVVPVDARVRQPDGRRADLSAGTAAVLQAERRQGWAEEVGLITPGLQSVAACAFDHTGHPCAAFSVTRRQDGAHPPAADLVRAVRSAAQQLTSALSGRPPEGWFAA